MKSKTENGIRVNVKSPKWIQIFLDPTTNDKTVNQKSFFLLPESKRNMMGTIAKAITVYFAAEPIPPAK